MAEVIREHDVHSDSGANGMALLIGVLLAVVLFLFLFYNFGRGLIGGTGTGTDTMTPQINVPERVNVDVNQK